MLSALQKAKESGAIIISVNPLRETGLVSFAHPQEIKGILGSATSLSDHYLQLRINSDMALFQVINKLLIEQNENTSCLDIDFIQERTSAFEAYKAHILQVDTGELIQQTGIDPSQWDSLSIKTPWIP